jgi:beta-glucosidase
MDPKYPASELPEDVAAASRMDAYANRHYLDPALLGTYPDELKEIFGDAWIEPSDEDMDVIRQPLDFLGVNYYTRTVTRYDDSRPPFNAVGERQTDALHTEMGWEVYPQAFTSVLTWIRDRYGDIPLYITENGSAFADPPAAIDGRIEDPERTRYLQRHLRAVHDAMQEGVNLRGYFAWSLLDNYEWSHGYTKRFGLVHVNYETQERTIKDTGRFYSEVIRSNGANL